MIQYTPKQLRMLRYICDHIKQMGIAPTFQEIADVTGVSLSAAYEMAHTLEEKGAIELRKGYARGIRVLDPAHAGPSLEELQSENKRLRTEVEVLAERVAQLMGGK